ncbi:hypothetical protein [Asanoa siamensis]|uniref:hypothetical protein n=1 Tax=Asanoa siamensis TaxID=926357 RepID=UPI00194421EA|nr:hypothetical protein [Asanoa siamensis]
MDYRDWSRGDDAPASSPRSRSSRSAEDRPRRSGARRGVRPTAAEPKPDAVSQWDPLGASGGELAAITQLEDTASLKLPKEFWKDEPADDDMVVVETGGGRGNRRDDTDEPPVRARRRRDEADDEIETSSGGRRRQDVSDSRGFRDDEIELSSGGRRRRDISDSRAARSRDDEIELSSGGRRRRDISDSRALRDRDDDVELSSGGRRRQDVTDSRGFRDDEIELSSGGRRRRDVSDSRALRDRDDEIELSSGARRRRDVSDSRAARDNEIELSSGGRRQRDVSDSRTGGIRDADVELASGGRRGRGVADARPARDRDDEIDLSSGGRRRRDDASDSGSIELSSGGRRRRDDVGDSRAGRDWSSGSTDIELSSGGRRRGDGVADSRAGRWDGDPELTSGGRRRAAESEPVSRGRRRVEDTGSGRSWRDEATDTELPSVGYAAGADVPGRRRGDDSTESEPVSRGRRRRRAAEAESGSPSWQTEATETELPDLGRRGDTGSIQVPLRGRAGRHTDDADPLTQPSRTRYGDGYGRRSRRAETEEPESDRPSWSTGATGVAYPEVTGTRLDRDDAPTRGRRYRRDEPDALEQPGRRARHGDQADPRETTGHGGTWSAGLDDTATRNRGRRHADDEPTDAPPSRGRRGRAEEPDEPMSRGRRARAAEPDTEDDGRGWRGDPANGDVPTQRRGRDDEATGDGRRRGSWAGEPDADRWRHPDMTGEWSRRAMAPLDQPQDRTAPPRDSRPDSRPDSRRDDRPDSRRDDRPASGRDLRPGQDAGRRDRREAARDDAAQTGGWRTDDPVRRRRDADSGHRPGGPADDTGSWERMTDTGQYDSTTSTSEWDRLVGSIEDEEAEEKFEAFWSGHRLAGDDPRWVETPATAPRSPAVGLPEPRRPEPDAYDDGGSRRGRTQADEELARAAMPPALDATDPGWGAPARATRRESAPTRPARAAAPQRQYTPQRGGMWQQEEFEQLDTDNGGFLAAVLYAAAWYAVPVLAFGIWLMTLPAVAIDDCISDVTGGGCESPRAQALEGLLSGVPQFGIALGISLIAAIALRWLGHSWRAGSVGLAAAVVGGGLSAVLNSVFTGQPLG